MKDRELPVLTVYQTVHSKDYVLGCSAFLTVTTNDCIQIDALLFLIYKKSSCWFYLYVHLFESIGALILNTIVHFIGYTNSS